MDKLIVDMNELHKYSVQLDENAQRFGTITRNMQEIIDSLKRKGWSGYDAEIFINNSVTYLEDLKVVKNDLIYTSDIIKRRNQKYSKRVSDFYDDMKTWGDKYGN